VVFTGYEEAEPIVMTQEQFEDRYSLVPLPRKP